MNANDPRVCRHCDGRCYEGATAGVWYHADPDFENPHDAEPVSPFLPQATTKTALSYLHRIPAGMIEPVWRDSTYQKVLVKFEVEAPRCHGTFQLTFSPEGEAHRQAFQGPLVEALFGDMSPNPVVIAAVQITDPRPTITVRPGDVIELEGFGAFTVGPPTATDYDRPTLIPR